MPTAKAYLHHVCHTSVAIVDPARETPNTCQRELFLDYLCVPSPGSSAVCDAPAVGLLAAPNSAASGWLGCV